MRRLLASIGLFETLLDVFFSPQALLEESANDRSKPEEPISRVLMRTPGSAIGPVLERFPEYMKHFGWAKQGSPVRLR